MKKLIERLLKEELTHTCKNYRKDDGTCRTGCAIPPQVKAGLPCPYDSVGDKAGAPPYLMQDEQFRSHFEDACPCYKA